MRVTLPKPLFKFYVPGRPKSGQSRHQKSYRETVAREARKVVPCPTRSSRIEVSVFYRVEGAERPDVDNVLKPILDALKGVVYHDDAQVRSVRCTALPTNEVFSVVGGESDLMSILGDQDQFLVLVFEGRTIIGY